MQEVIGSIPISSTRSNVVKSKILCGGIAQLGEHLLCKQRVYGSIPYTSTIDSGLQLSWESACMACKRSSVRSRLAPPLSQKQKPPMGVQLSWESICFASRGSTVRSRIPPPYFKTLTGLFLYLYVVSSQQQQIPILSTFHQFSHPLSSILGNIFVTSICSCCYVQTFAITKFLSQDTYINVSKNDRIDHAHIAVNTFIQGVFILFWQKLT